LEFCYFNTLLQFFWEEKNSCCWRYHYPLLTNERDHGLFRFFQK
jgi:hypothetical protein